MPARKLFAAGLVVIAVAGCSNPAADPVVADESLLAELELAISAAAGTGATVLSPLELTRSNEAGEAPRVTPAPRTAVRPSARAVPVALLGQPVMSAAVDVSESAAPAAAESEPVGALAVADDGGADHSGHAGSAGPARNTGNRPRIIIRGGGSVLDDCKRHLPGTGGIAGVLGTGGGIDGILGTVGVMINDRTPPVISGGSARYPGNGRAPTTRAGGYPGGTGGFAGGIR